MELVRFVLDHFIGSCYIRFVGFRAHLPGEEDILKRRENDFREPREGGYVAVWMLEVPVVVRESINMG